MYSHSVRLPGPELERAADQVYKADPYDCDGAVLALEGISHYSHYRRSYCTSGNAHYHEPGYFVGFLRAVFHGLAVEYGEYAGAEKPDASGKDHYQCRSLCEEHAYK